jgi:hypothetical protein
MHRLRVSGIGLDFMYVEGTVRHSAQQLVARELHFGYTVPGESMLCLFLGRAPIEMFD